MLTTSGRHMVSILSKYASGLEGVKTVNESQSMGSKHVRHIRSLVLLGIVILQRISFTLNLVLLPLEHFCFSCCWLS